MLSLSGNYTIIRPSYFCGLFSIIVKPDGVLYYQKINTYALYSLNISLTIYLKPTLELLILIINHC